MFLLLLFCRLGVVVNVFGSSLINDRQLMDDFWAIVEHALNTILFTLGGLVWGGIISNPPGEDTDLYFTGMDWGYLVTIYVS